ncbi:hypothetical protein R5R35_007169 [Gryllus longicercus]|uniref:Uncharacterized protein n=1 Tax=Gryllus longicercus TaxID=2509291 RepID=A0AAN9V8K0_9ORTH
MAPHSLAGGGGGGRQYSNPSARASINMMPRGPSMAAGPPSPSPSQSSFALVGGAAGRDLMSRLSSISSHSTFPRPHFIAAYVTSTARLAGEMLGQSHEPPQMDSQAPDDYPLTPPLSPSDSSPGMAPSSPPPTRTSLSEQLTAAGRLGGRPPLQPVFSTIMEQSSTTLTGPDARSPLPAPGPQARYPPTPCTSCKPCAQTPASDRGRRRYYPELGHRDFLGRSNIPPFHVHRAAQGYNRLLEPRPLRLNVCDAYTESGLPGGNAAAPNS